ncbi:MAG: putative coiled-coil protein [Streblomastix strix]|uniref:Splicing factor YJU2 n=1 Tax=Streblomastix strix TaxID=222440 RepID=A0A5J4WBJ6_9EUKA|nr:MAG: putative coiled-coil protein [Streblomastix strix]
MAERKVLNKYIPPDFDPSLIGRGKVPKNVQFNIRMMLPMSIRCGSCGEFLPAGTKLNSKQEIAKGDFYMGLRVYRFYMKCSRCSAEFTILTNIKDNNYICELNCTEHYAPHWKQQKIDDEEAIKQREREDEDAIRALENRALDNKAALEREDAIVEMRKLNSRNNRAKADDVITYIEQRDKQKKKEKEKEIKDQEERFKQDEEEDISHLFVRRIDDSLRQEIMKEQGINQNEVEGDYEDEDEEQFNIKNEDKLLGEKLSFANDQQNKNIQTNIKTESNYELDSLLTQPRKRTRDEIQPQIIKEEDIRNPLKRPRLEEVKKKVEKKDQKNENKLKNENAELTDLLNMYGGDEIDEEEGTLNVAV